MPEQLFALKRDLDMVTEDVQWLKKSYNLLDYIAKVVRGCEMEQMAQAAQMRRMDERFDRIDATLNILVKHLGIKLEE